MSSTRSPKWDWSSHLTKMIELYKLRISITDIHKAIQCDGFEPCERAVYSKFASLGYPTDPIGRTKLLDANFAHNANSQVDFQTKIDTWTNNSNGLCPLPEDVMLVGPIESWENSCEKGSTPVGQEFEYMDMRDSGDQFQHGNFCLDRSIRSPGAHILGSDKDPVTLQASWSPTHGITTTQNLRLPTDASDKSFECHIRPPEPDVVTYSSQNTTLHSRQAAIRPSHHTSNHINHPFHTPNSYTGTTGSANSMKKIRAWFRPKPSGPSVARKRYTDSQFTNTRDSGYASSAASRSTFRELHEQPQSLREFNSLYRVACFTLHEPHDKTKFKDIPLCTYCGYASIHNLGWSARYLKFEVFSSELKLSEVYDLGALDAAGNTALHYAAAGGAGLQHLKALIGAGVNPYSANTAGELFIYCLRPLQPFTLEPNSDCLNGNDLVHLLELLEPQRAFDWRNNDGQTILHALALKIKEPEVKTEIFRMFTEAGYPPNVQDRFGRGAEDIVSLTYDCHGQVLDHNSPECFQHVTEIIEEAEHAGGQILCNGLDIDEWRLQHSKQIDAHKIIEKALHHPRYVDPETGDNVVHAFSRLKSSNDILLYLQCFIPRDVDLNLHNREGKHPLMSFICDRPWEEGETGATMSKYLDAILWKTPKERISNKINVNMKDRDGVTALHSAAIRGRPDSARSLIDAGANVNARLDAGLSVLQATYDALDEAVMHDDDVLIHLLKEVVSHLKHANAVVDPTSFEERRTSNL